MPVLSRSRFLLISALLLLAVALTPAASHASPAAQEVPQQFVAADLFSLPRGAGIGELGLRQSLNGEPTVGPEGIAISGDKIYLLDSVNTRIAVASVGGSIQQTIALAGGTWASDLALGATGEMYVLDARMNRVLTYDAHGQSLQPPLLLDPTFQGSHLSTRDGQLQVEGQQVSASSSRPQRAVLTWPLTSSGAINTSARPIMLSKAGATRDGPASVWLDKTGPQGGAVHIRQGSIAADLSIETRDPLAFITLIDTDAAGNYYLLVASSASPDPSLLLYGTRLDKYAPDGKLLASAPLPMAMDSVPEHPLAVAADGSVFQILPTLEGTKVVRWTTIDAGVTAAAAPPSWSPPVPVTTSSASPQAPALTTISREQIIATAKTYADLQWTVGSANYGARTCSNSCPVGPAAWSVGTTVTGMAYQWGGYDTIAQFNNKLSQGYLAGDVSGTACTGNCATGVDCSGYVQQTWQVTDTKHNVDQLMDNYAQAINWTDLLGGDALAKRGSHITLFVDWDDQGHPIIYESTWGTTYKVRYFVDTVGYLNGYEARRRFNVTGSKPTAPSNPSPADNALLERTNDTTLAWNSNGTSCTVHVWGGNIDQKIPSNCVSLPVGQQPGGSYAWQVKASNATGSVWGPQWHVKIKPYGPTSLTATATSQSALTLKWTLSADEPNDVDSYELYNSNGTLLASVAKGTKSYPVSGLTCGTTYSFYAQAKRQGVLSNKSNTTSTTTTSCNAPPAAPSNLRTTLAGLTSITLAWDDNSSNEDGFNLYRWSGSDWSKIAGLGAGVTTYADSNLTCGTEQKYRVSAYNGYGETYAVADLTASTAPCVPAAPSNLQATGATASTITLTWTDNSNNESEFRIYHLEGATWIRDVGVSGGVQSFTITGLACGLARSYRVTAANISGESGPSNQVAASTLPCPPIVQDTSLAIQYDGWRGVKDAGANGGGYRVSNRTNDTLSFRFSGSSVAWLTALGPDQGKASVKIDGVSRGVIDLYASSLQPFSKTFTGLGAGGHNLVIKVTGQKNASATGTNVIVDGFIAASKTTQEDACTIKYDSWICSSNVNSSDGGFRYSATRGATATLVFSGASVDWLSATGNYGLALVTLDGVDQPQVNLCGAAAWQAPFSFTPATGATHTITVQVLGAHKGKCTSNRIIVDAFRGVIAAD